MLKYLEKKTFFHHPHCAENSGAFYQSGGQKPKNVLCELLSVKCQIKLNVKSARIYIFLSSGLLYFWSGNSLLDLIKLWLLMEWICVWANC